MKNNIRAFVVISYEFIMSMLFSLPRYRFFLFFKILFLRLRGAKIGKRVIIYPRVWIAPGNNLELGDDVSLAKGVLIITRDGGKLTIGDRTIVGFDTKFITSNHEIPPIGKSIFYGGSNPSDIVIGTDAWIGANCFITAGVTIGNGAVVGAGSIVTKDVEENTIVAGVPAKLIRKRKDK